MNHVDSIAKSIQRIARLGRPPLGEVMEAICQAVDKDSATMSVRFHEGGEVMEGVKLQLYEAKHKMLFLPKANTHVLLLCINGNQNDLYCVAAEEYEDVAFSIAGKYTMQSGEADLKLIFAKVLEMVKNLVVLTSQGQSVGLSPKSLQDIDNIDKELKKFFE